jgi:hypothetical protein
VELLRANYNFRAVVMDVGDHTVEMVYRPLSARCGAAVSLVTLFTVAMVWLVRQQGR